MTQYKSRPFPDVSWAAPFDSHEEAEEYVLTWLIEEGMTVAELDRLGGAVEVAEVAPEDEIRYDLAEDGHGIIVSEDATFARDYYFSEFGEDFGE